MRHRHLRGFTLIELLVAISILAIVAVLGWRGLDGIVRARIALTAQMAQTRGMQLTFAQMQSDCEHLAGVALVQQRANLDAGANRLTLVRTVLLENEPVSLQVVAYRVKDGVLTRHESLSTRDLAVLDTLWQAALSDLDTANGVVLQADVSAMSVQVWDSKGWHVPTGTVAAGQGATQTVVPVPLLPNQTTGLQVALQLLGQSTSMVKMFLLGAV